MSILLGAALAAAMASGQDYAQQRVAPRGGYTQSCSEAYVNRGRLYADCRDTRGRMRGTCSSEQLATQVSKKASGSVARVTSANTTCA